MDGLHIPAHVSPALVRDFNYYDQPDCDADPHAAWKLLHDGPDIFFSPHFGGHWVVTRGADIKAMIQNHEVFSSTVNSIPNDPRPFRMAPIEYDPPEHGRLKAMGIPSFSPVAVKKLERTIRDLCSTLIDGFIGKGACEFVSDFALRMPISVFMQMTGMPDEHRPMVLGWVEDKLRNPDPEVQHRAVANLVAYSREVLANRLAHTGGDLISELIRASPGGEAASHDELLGYITLLWFAGLDTVSSAMGFIMRFLANNPAHRRQLRDDASLIPNAIEEMIRRFGVSTPSRILARNINYNGIEMRAGDMVLLPVTLYGLDERIYPDPLNVDFKRQDASLSLVFGTGIHRCIGSFLARFELRIFLELWLARIPDFSVDASARTIARAGVVNSMLSLPLIWDVGPPAL